MKRNCKKYTLQININKHPGVIEKLDNVENRNAYIINLIKKDISE